VSGMLNWDIINKQKKITTIIVSINRIVYFPADTFSGNLMIQVILPNGSINL